MLDVTSSIANAELIWTSKLWADWIEDQLLRRAQVATVLPQELTAAYERETRYTREYHGRELLELLQNADDAGSGYDEDCRAIIALTNDGLCVGNTGRSFSVDGVASLLISDNSPKKRKSARFIGNKGLGFRALLNWTDAPFILSGNLKIGFDRSHAKQWLKSLAEGDASISIALEKWRANSAEPWPIPVLAVPIHLDTDRLTSGSPPRSTQFSSIWTLAQELRDEGYDTVVGLPFKTPAAFVEVLEQLRDIDREALLFTNNLRILTVRRPGFARSWTKAVGGSAVEITSPDISTQMWEIFVERETIPDEFLAEHQRETPDYEIKLAVPTDGPTPGVLYNYFRTNVRFPYPLYAHATLELTGNRDYITKSPSNRYIVERLARLMTKVAEQSAERLEPWKPLALISPTGSIDTVLDYFGFGEHVLHYAHTRKLIPTQGGGLYRVAEALRTRVDVSDWLPVDGFEDIILSPPTRHLQQTLAALCPDTISDELLRERLNIASPSLTLSQRASLVAGLITLHLLPTNPTPSLLIDGNGSLIPPDVAIFLPSTDKSNYDLPQWLEVRILDGGLAAELRSCFDVATARSLADKLGLYGIQEYSLAPLVSAINARTNMLARSNTANEPRYRLEALSAIFKLYRSSLSLSGVAPTLPQSTRVSLPTQAGNFAPADELYISREYPGGALVDALYAGHAPETMVASMPKLGLSGKAEEVTSFLLWLGSADRPRSVMATSDVAQNFTRWACAQLQYPAQFTHSTVISTPEELDRASLTNVTYIDRLSAVLANADAEAILAWAAEESRLDSWRVSGDSGAELAIFPGRVVLPRKLREQSLPSYITWMLANKAWLPVVGGSKRPPGQCILSTSLPEEARQSLARPNLRLDHPLLKERNLDSLRVYQALERIGVRRSLDDITWDQFYTLLLDHPRRDPEGKGARGLYRALITKTDEGNPPQGKSWEKFMQRGMLWGNKGGEAGYFKREMLYYAENMALPETVLRSVPLLHLSGRPGIQKVQRIFGVAPLDENSVTVEIQAFEPSRAHGELQEEVQQLKPYIYALRMSDNAEITQFNRLKALQIHLCAAISGATVIDGIRSPFTVSRPGDRVIQGDCVYLLQEDDLPARLAGNDLLADALGEILASVLRVRANADFARMASCQLERRPQLLSRILRVSATEARELLHEANTRLELLAHSSLDADATRQYVPPADPGTSTSRADGVRLRQDRPANTSHVSHDTPNPELSVVRAVASDPPQAVPSRTISLRIRATPRTSTSTVSYQPVTDAARCELVAERFEEAEGQNRFPLSVAHLQGTRAFGCDLLSFASAADRESFRISSDETLISRYIEVKGSSKARGTIDLSGNELSAARSLRDRYYLYRIFEDADNHYSIAVLADPLSADHDEVHRIDPTSTPTSTHWQITPID